MFIILDVGILIIGVYYWMIGCISFGVIVLILYYMYSIFFEVWNFLCMINVMI